MARDPIGRWKMCIANHLLPVLNHTYLVGGLRLLILYCKCAAEFGGSGVPRQLSWTVYLGALQGFGTDHTP